MGSFRLCMGAWWVRKSSYGFCGVSPSTFNAPRRMAASVPCSCCISRAAWAVAEFDRSGTYFRNLPSVTLTFSMSSRILTSESGNREGVPAALPADALLTTSDSFIFDSATVKYKREDASCPLFYTFPVFLPAVRSCYFPQFVVQFNQRASSRVGPCAQRLIHL